MVKEQKKVFKCELNYEMEIIATNEDEALELFTEEIANINSYEDLIDIEETNELVCIKCGTKMNYVGDINGLVDLFACEKCGREERIKLQ